MFHLHFFFFANEIMRKGAAPVIPAKAGIQRGTGFRVKPGMTAGRKHVLGRLPSRGNGFTLIEILVALAIFLVIISALYATFFISHRAVDAVDDSLLRLQECRAVVDTLKREIEAAFYDPDPLKTYSVFKLDDRDFYGKQASQLLFTSFSQSLPGVAKISYTVEENDGRLILRKRIASVFGQSDETKAAELVEDIEAFTVEARYGGRWVKTWDSGLIKSIPEEIRISLKIVTRREKDGAAGDDSMSSFSISDVARPKINKAI